MQSGGQNVKQVFHRILPRWIQSPINLQSLLPLSLSQQVEVLHRALHVLVVRGSAPLHLIKLNPCGPVWFLRVRNEHLSSADFRDVRSEEHTSELQSRQYLVCRLLFEETSMQHPII